MYIPYLTNNNLKVGLTMANEETVLLHNQESTKILFMECFPHW